MASYVAALFLLTSGFDLILTAFLWARRSSRASLALAGLCLANALWTFSYGAALLTEGAVSTLGPEQAVTWWMRWGNLQYLGVAGLAPFWLLFMLLWTKRTRFVNAWLVTGLLLEGLTVFALVAIPATRNLVRTPPVDLSTHPWTAGSGPLYLPHYLYLVSVLTLATVIFLIDLWRRSQLFRWAVLGLTFAALFPFAVNLAFNIGITRYDFTPLAFSTACCILTWGVISQHLIRLAPIAHRQMVDGLSDAVLVVDIFGNVVESNPSAAKLLDLLPAEGSGLVKRQLPGVLEPVVGLQGSSDLRLNLAGSTRFFEIQVNDLPDARGHAGGRLVVLRDITERREDERQRTRILAEQARVADILSRSLRPESLPSSPGVEFAAEYRPAAAGRELGGDFYDVYRCDDYWAFTIGDVSGKGAPAAAVTALARYTLRALTTSRLLSPPLAVKAMNRQILSSDDQEKYITVAHGWCQATPLGEVRVDFVLGGHPLPLLLTAEQSPVRAVGTPGTAVGLLATIDLHNEQVLLAPGDALVFFTDGVTEARRGREFFGDGRVAEHLAAQRGADAEEIARSLMAAVLDFQRGELSDDTAILVIAAPRHSPFAHDPSI